MTKENTWNNKKITTKKAININTFLTTINKYKNQKNYDKNKLKKQGIYILHNKTKNKYYIGQAHNLIKRIKEHFHGKSGTQKEEIYHDYKKNNYFTIKIIITDQLNEIEKQIIWYFRANKNLYNTKKYSLNFWKDIIKIHNKKYYDKINNDPMLKNIWRNI